MVLKRKRSDSEISTSSSLFSSPPSAPQYMSIDSYQSPQSRIPTPSLFASRTRKRHRDNRPSEAEIHQHTLSMLYSAQQNLQSQTLVTQPFQSQAPVDPLPSSNQICQQSSLHSFWTLPSSATRQSSPSSTFSNSSSNTPSITTNPALNAFFPATNCEDCNASFRNGNSNGNSMDIDMMDMDLSMDMDENYACTACGKQVCHSCSVTNLGENRRCLNCAKPAKVWIGGLGWTLR